MLLIVIMALIHVSSDMLGLFRVSLLRWNSFLLRRGAWWNVIVALKPSQIRFNSRGIRSNALKSSTVALPVMLPIVPQLDAQFSFQRTT